MAVNGLAGFHGSAVHPTRVLRNLAATLLGQPSVSHANSATATTRGGCYGVAGGGDLAVTVTSGLGFSVAAGRLAGPGTTALAQGGYVGYNDAAVVSAVGARNATNPRIDYVAYRVRDTDEDATGAEDDGLIVIAGTAAAPPVPPTLSASQGTLVILAEILVPSSANGGPIAITDRRAYLSAIGGIQRCTSTTRPLGAALWEGVVIVELDTNRMWVYSGAAWIPYGNYGAWSTAGVTLVQQGVPVSNTNLSVRYSQIGKQVIGSLDFNVTSAGSSGSEISLTGVTLPAIRSDRSNAGSFTYNRNGVIFYQGAVNFTTAGTMTFIASGNAGTLGFSPSFAMANGDIMHITLTYEAA